MKISIEEQVKQSKRYPWIAAHRGGPLSLCERQQLIRWARECVEHVLHLLGGEADPRILDALTTAKEWENGNASTGICMRKSLAAHAAARASVNEIHRAVARAAGQTVATAHMADHSLGGAHYALKAIKLADLDLMTEKQWQEDMLSLLSDRIQQLIMETWQEKKLDKRI
ncbi:putative immunity protein [Pedobacter sp. WC2501]|uniref:putative immunity protein n=1 Tax=Pedobacter sp. WC2501 TaxID=3461400 RepID=UPI0040466EED